MSVNKVMLIGNLGNQPEVRMVGERPVTSLRLATHEKRGEQSVTEWHDVTVWGKQAESCVQYLLKGKLVYVEGRLRTREYEKDGVKHFRTEIEASKVDFIGHGNFEKAAD